MVLVDTSVWIDYVRGVDSVHTNCLDELLDRQRIIIGDLIIVELLQGFRHKKELDKMHELIGMLEYRDLVGKEIAIKAAENFRFLKAKGFTVRKTIDMLIGTFCIENHITLLHNDRDFDPMQKLLGLYVATAST